LMTVAAIFAVLWPLSRSSAPQAGGNEATVYKDQLAEIDRDVAAGLMGGGGRGGGWGGENRSPPAGRRGSRTRVAGPAEPRPAPRLGRRGAGGAADRGGDVLSVARIAAARGLSAGVAHPPCGRQSAAGQHGGAGRSASGKKSDRWARLDRAGAGAGAARPLRRRRP